jgi:hypothetical protein
LNQQLARAEPYHFSKPIGAHFAGIRHIIPAKLANSLDLGEFPFKIPYQSFLMQWHLVCEIPFRRGTSGRRPSSFKISMERDPGAANTGLIKQELHHGDLYDMRKGARGAAP